MKSCNEYYVVNHTHTHTNPPHKISYKYSITHTHTTQIPHSKIPNVHNFIPKEAKNITGDIKRVKESLNNVSNTIKQNI